MMMSALAPMVIPMIECSKVAKYFLSCTDEEIEDTITNLKLQKLVYYAQGVFLALHGAPLFNERIEAWAHGPVVPVLYHKYKKYGASAIPREEIELNDYPPQVKEVLEEVWTVYGQFSASRLRTMTHAEEPWKSAYGKFDCGISNDSMLNYFKTQIEA